MHLKIFSSQMITPIGPKMSTAIEELIHTSYLKNKNEILTGMVHIPGWPYAMSCMFSTLNNS